VSESGTAMLGLLLGTVAGATFSGRMIPHFVHYKRIAMVGLSLAIVCIGVLSAIAGHASLIEVEILTTLVGVGSGTTFPVSTVSVQNAVDRAHL
ncbi:MFS transporter, partial [bacterium M00.F.Ca.ET.229.01.1.1]